MTMNEQSVLAIDVGSSCVKLGWFPARGACASPSARGALPIAAPPLPEPDGMLRVQHAFRADRVWLAEMDRWLDELPLAREVRCLIGSVHSQAAETLCKRLVQREALKLRQLAATELSIAVRVNEPLSVGVDRLLGALAVNRVRRQEAPAIAVDMGTAITVDLIAADGAFEGGAIVAGPALTLKALHAGTTSLPRLDESVLRERPSAVGKSTTAAMASGAYWGAIGAVRELIQRIADGCPATPDVFLTGGAAEGYAPQIALGDRPARYMPNLVLAGIRLAADHLPALRP